MTIVDATAWSLRVRRRPSARLTERETAIRELLTTLIAAGEAVLIGAVRQEVLTGIAAVPAFERVREALDRQTEARCEKGDHELAARFANQCRRAGIAASPTDSLIAAVASRLDADILSTDIDFERIASVVPIRLHPLSRSVGR